jgi:hypothetical protein
VAHERQTVNTVLREAEDASRPCAAADAVAQRMSKRVPTESREGAGTLGIDRLNGLVGGEQSGLFVRLFFSEKS